ncbi:helix-hairpin-helix domain-containing protein [Ammoniphilus sp. 3BR4]|uniref:helix-hairpin-helix domain-containing protein n=1 Tax=Ammoniphilus sp. 3BR4 TaxID=3158265 RepID=UPI0034676F21
MLSWTPREKKLALLSAIAILLLFSLLYYVWRSDQGEEPVPFPSYSIEGATSPEKEEDEPMPDLPKMIWIDVKGAVARPGVYELAEDARVYEVIEQSGGLLPEADSRGVNLAKSLLDGEVVYVPIKGELPAEGQVLGSDPSQPKPRVNINTASAEELTGLPGIGEVKAAAIIDYRTKQGMFKKESDLKNVTGIGDKLYEKVEEHIRVK